ncbi:DUF721 domain-containing protein [Xanthovirga aplysinae]|uniref:DUF721 domain-containing protein n=1 Tax=Xanthovirga aplysinae TaxID=2529853 RepID=UPI0012BB6219|nr:DUF721 domain-containing protein [Xanthovirga aplysinae]MTI33519.1 DUF721 domain-containing protein [Xanthovirga aplysinae]
MRFKTKTDHNLRKSETSTVGEAFQEMLKAYRLKNRFTATQIVHSWTKLMGPPIGNRTEKVRLKDKTLFVTLNSAPLKHELSLSKFKIIEIFNREFGEDTIEEVVFL